MHASSGPSSRDLKVVILRDVTLKVVTLRDVTQKVDTQSLTSVTPECGWREATCPHPQVNEQSSFPSMPRLGLLGSSLLSSLTSAEGFLFVCITCKKALDTRLQGASGHLQSHGWHAYRRVGPDLWKDWITAWYV